MSSRVRETGGSGGSGGVIVAHPAEDLVADPAPKSSDRLGLRIAQGSSVLEVSLAWALALELGDRDPMEPHVELSVARAAEPVALVVGGPDRDRCRAVVAGKGGGRAEAADAGRLADELGRGERAAADQGEQRRREDSHESADLALEGVDRDRQLADPPPDYDRRPSGKRSTVLATNDSSVGTAD
jgi:hypothetical protein